MKLNVSLVEVRVSTVANACLDARVGIKARRQKEFEKTIVTLMERPRKFLWFKKSNWTREQALKEMDRLEGDCWTWTYCAWTSFGYYDLERARYLQHMCDVASNDVMYLSPEDAQFVSEWARK